MWEFWGKTTPFKLKEEDNQQQMMQDSQETVWPNRVYNSTRDCSIILASWSTILRSSAAHLLRQSISSVISVWNEARLLQAISDTSGCGSDALAFPAVASGSATAAVCADVIVRSLPVDTQCSKTVPTTYAQVKFYTKKRRLLDIDAHSLMRNFDPIRTIYVRVHYCIF